jgi:hypothetical protein
LAARNAGHGVASTGIQGERPMGERRIFAFLTCSVARVTHFRESAVAAILQWLAIGSI